MATRRTTGFSYRVLDRVSVLLERVAPWIALVERPVRRYTIAGAVAVVWLIALFVRATEFGAWSEVIALVVISAILLVPVGVLGLFVVTMRQMIALPEQIRGMPQTSKEQGARLAAALNAMRQPRRSGVRGSVVGLWRTRGAVGELAGLVEPVLGIASLLRLPFLLLVVVAAVLVAVEILIALVALAVVVLR